MIHLAGLECSCPAIDLGTLSHMARNLLAQVAAARRAGQFPRMLARESLVGMMSLMSWHQKFQKPSEAEAWDEAYSDQNYNTFIWELQRTRVREVFALLQAANPRLSHLDFACGTGRVMQAVADLAWQSTGVDISLPMITRAQSKLPQATFKHGNVLANTEVFEGQYDVITAFRFFLNADPEVRTPVLRLLGSHLRDERSRLIFNIHSNLFSYLGVRNTLLPLPNEQSMSYAAARRLIEDAGLQVDRWYGFGVLPFRRMHSTWLRPLLARCDAWASHRMWLRRVSGDLLFICKPPAPMLRSETATIRHLVSV